MLVEMKKIVIYILPELRITNNVVTLRKKDESVLPVLSCLGYLLLVLPRSRNINKVLFMRKKKILKHAKSAAKARKPCIIINKLL